MLCLFKNVFMGGCSDFQQAHKYQMGKIYNLERQVRLFEMKGLKVTDSITASFLFYTSLIANHSVSEMFAINV